MAVEVFDTFDDMDMGIFNEIPDIEEPEDPTEEDQEGDKKNKETGEQDEPVEGVAGEKDQKKEKEPEGKEPDSSPSLYSSLAKVLSEEGLLPSYDPKKTKYESKEELIEAFKESIKNSEYADLTDTQKKYLQAIRAGIPEQEALQSISATSNLESITKEEIESNEQLRKQLIVNDFLTKGYSQERAEKLAQRSFDIGEDVNDSIEALESIKDYTLKQEEERIREAERQRELKRKENEEQINKLKETITGFTELIPGHKISEKDKQKIYEQATKPVAQLPNGQYVNAVIKAKLENPVEFESKLNYLFYVTKGFKDFSLIEKKTKSKATKELEDFLKGNTFIPSGSESTEKLDYDPYNSEISQDIIDNII